MRSRLRRQRISGAQPLFGQVGGPVGLRCPYRIPAAAPASDRGKEPTMEIKELGHLVLYVHNVERSAAFYRDVLGWREIFSAPDDGPARVAAFSAPSGRTPHELLLIEVGEEAL